MNRLHRALLLGFFLFTSRAAPSLDVHDTLISGVPWVAITAKVSPKPGKGAKPDPTSLRIDTDHKVARARLTPSKGPAWTVWDGNPFVREGDGVVSLVIAPRITNKSLLVPRDSRLAQLVSVSVPAAKPVAKTLPAPKLDTTVVKPLPRDTTPDTSSKPTAPALSTKVVQDTSPSPPTPAIETPAATAKTNSDINGDDGVFTVVIDAGHGGKDPGASGQKVEGKALLEKNTTLGIALKLREELKAMKGVRVVMTRETDVFISLGERTRIANASKGDLFVSIHCNSLPLNSDRRDEVNGFMVYLLREAKSKADRAIERRENEAIKFETGERQHKEALSPVEWMMLEHQLNQYTKESERFTGLVVQNLSKKGPVKKERTGAGQAGFFVLVGALMPSVLVETGYLSHTSDASNLGSDEGRKSIAKQIAHSIDEFRHSRS